MKRYLLLAALLPALTLKAGDTCKIGIYVLSLYDFKVKEKSFNTNFWMWRVYRENSGFDFEKTTEIVNAKEASFGNQQIDKRDPYNWTTQMVKAETRMDW